MKKLFFPLVALFCLAACSTPMGAVENFNDSYLLHVECAPGVSTKNEVLLLLKRGHAKDIRVDEGGTGMTIEAAYYKVDNDLGMVESIADDLKLVSAVIEVEIRDNVRVVRENR